MRSSDLATTIDPPTIAARTPAVWLVEPQEPQLLSQLYAVTAVAAGSIFLSIGLLVWRFIAFGV